jgi:hypothetical protein
MRLRESYIGFVLVAAVALALLCSQAGAGDNRYVEDFTSKASCDALNTTAFWDTTTGELGLHPFELTLAGACGTPGTAVEVAIVGDYAYVADLGSGLRVVDISDPTLPVSVGDYDTPGNARGVAIAGDYAYVADEDSGLHVVDISDPTIPVLAGSYDTPEQVVGVAVAGNHAYLANRYSGLLVIDISDPTSPDSVGCYDTPGDAWVVAIAGNCAYVADYTSGLQVIDISDPTSPDSVGSYATPGYARSVAVEGNYAYVAARESGLQVINISDPTSPVWAGGYDTPDMAMGVAIAGNYAYIGDRISGLQVVDISDPTLPVSAGSYATPDNAYGVAVAGEHAFVTNRLAGLQVIHIAESLDPPLWAGAYNTSGYAYSVVVTGNYAYVADGSFGFQVIDISDPTTPTPAGNYNSSFARDVVISGDYAYIADDSYGLKVIDISDPTNPTNAFSSTGIIGSVAISGDYLFVTGGTGGAGCYVYDISNPTSPTQVGSCTTPGSASGIEVNGDYVYVADWGSGLQVIDITDPTSPFLAGGYDTPGYVRRVAIEGNYAYVADWDAGLQVIEITDPTTPTLAGSYDTPGSVMDVFVSGDYAFVADSGSGVQVIDISDPTTPVLVGSYDTPSEATGLVIYGDHAYVADAGSGLQVIQVFQRSFDLEANAAQSVVVNPLDEEIREVRVSTTQTDSIYWYASADSGSTWEEVAPNTGWQRLTSPGDDLLWKSTHVYCANFGVNPTCSSLKIEWMSNYALVDSIVDVPADQGGRAYMSFTRSHLDAVDEATYPVTQYGLYRRVDDAALEARIQSLLGMSVGSAEKGVGPLPGAGTISMGGTRYVMGSASVAGTFPPGTWALVATVPATQSDSYLAEVTTVADSTSAGTNYSVYVMTTHTTTPSVWYISSPDSGYSVDNLPPQMPAALAGQHTGGTDLWLHWNLGIENDLSHWAVYRGTTPDFVADEVSRIGTTTNTSYVDGDYDHDGPYYYKVSAIDVHENESPHALLSPDGLTEVPGGGRTYANALYQNVPNPFGSGTQIAFSLEKTGRVSLKIFDAKGRLVRELVDEARAPNHYVEVWDGRDNRGRSAAAGMYFYRLELPGWKAVKKMTLVK